MSRYADLADVQALVPQRRFAAQTTPTVDEVLRACTNRSAELDLAIVRRGYSLPLTEAASPLSYAWLRSACAYGAAMDAEAAGFPAQADVGETPRLAFLRRQWERMLGDLRDGAIDLADAGSPDPEGLAAGFRYREADPDEAAWFRRDQAHGAGGPRSYLP